MNAATFCEQFATFADAPDGVEKLRALILQLAVQGRLVQRNQRDEPAGRALSRLDAARQLANERGVSRLQPLPPINFDDSKIQLPSGWEWVRLGNVVNVLNGRAYSKAELLVAGPTPVLRVGNLFTSNHWYYSDLELECEKYCDAGDLIYAWSASFGPFIWLGPRVIYHYHIWKLSPFDVASIDKEYLRLFLQKETEAIKAAGHGVSMIHMTKEKMEKLLVPFPPLAEQRRIVAKVDQLLGLCDELAARQAARRDTRSALVGATLDRLVSARSSAEFPAHAHRLRDHFERLFDTPTTLPKLRQALLQLAVQGQLVPQDPNDEPASALQSKILAKRKRLIENGEITAFATDTEWPDGALPYSLPDGWEWVRFGELGGFLGGGTPSKDRADYWDGKIPWVSPKDMKRPYMNDAIDHVSPLGVENSSGKMIPKGSLLMVVRGMILAHSFPVALAMRELTINQDMKALQLALPELGEYLLRCCAACKPRMLGFVERSSHGTCRLPTEAVANFPIPLPPLAEQKRIVSKVTELLSLCDALEAKLTQAESASTQLLSAAVHNLLVTES